VLVVVSGLPGTGKSTLADALAPRLGAVVCSVDPIEGAIVRAGIPQGFETGLAAYLVAEAVADAALRGGLPVIVDAVSSVEPARDMWRSLAARHGVPLHVLVCELPDDGAALARLAGRRRGLGLPEPGPANLAARRAEWTPWPEPQLVIDGARPVGEGVERALAWLGHA
jgi:predicted kinase